MAKARKRKGVETNHNPRPCDGPCHRPIPVSEPGWVILLDGRLLCDECYRAEAEERVRFPYGRNELPEQKRKATVS